MREELHRRLLRELLKNSKRSDRDLAKILKVSQPTITRARHRLEKDGMIEDYTIVPNFRQMGFEIMVINLAKIRPEVLSEAKERATAFIEMFPNTILASAGEGMGMNAVSIAFYRNYTEYHKRVNSFRTEWKDFVQDIQSFIVPIGEGEFKRFSLSYLKDAPI